MKKIYLATALAAIAALASCTKENSLIITDETATDPVIQSFTACTAGAKAVVDGVSIKWKSTDTISLYNGVGMQKGVNFTTTADNAATATFSGTGAVKTDGYYYAAYPASAVHSWNNSEDNYLRIYIPEIQYAVVNGLPSNAGAMWAKSDGTSLSFNHLGGYVKLVFDSTSPTDITEIEFIDGAASPAKPSGLWIVKMPEETPSIANSSYTQTLKLRMKDGSAFGPGTYYLNVRPRTYSSGIKLKFTNSAGNVCEVSTSESINLSSGRVQSVGTVKGLNFPTGVPKIGDIYKEGGVAKGIVCHIDTDYYAVMSLTKKQGVQWSNSKENTMKVNDKNDGRTNCATVVKEANLETVYPAIYYCTTLGEGWYLPASNEMTTIIGEIKIDSEEGLAAFNTKITAAGGTAITTPYGSYRFWCSNTDNNGAKAYYAYYSTNKVQIASTTQNKNSSSYSARCLKRISFVAE